MTTKTLRLPQPTEDLVRSYIENFDQSQVIVERALAKLFRLFPHNTTPEDVLLKVVALNDLYRTGILATSRLAEHILHLNIDGFLQAGQSEAVELIAQVQIGNKTRNNYSFATKYCSWHNPNAYPIFDSYVEQMLWSYRKQDGFSGFQRQDLRKYRLFRQAIQDFRQSYHLFAFDIKDIDKFLWLAGKARFPTSWAQSSPPAS